MTRQRVRSWLPDIQKAKARLPQTVPIPDSLILAFIQVESDGDENVYIPASGQTSIKKNNSQGRVDVPITNRLIMGGFQGSTVWYNDWVAREFRREERIDVYQYMERIRNNREIQVYDWLRSMINRAGTHKYKPDLMAMTHNTCGSGSCARRFNRILESDGANAALEYAKGKVSRYTRPGQAYLFSKKIQEAHIYWAGQVGDPDPTNDYLLDWTAPTPTQIDGGTVSGLKPRELNDIPEGLPFVSARFVTPEELRKGIVAQFFRINDWHVTQIGDPEEQEVRETKDRIYTPAIQDQPEQPSGQRADASTVDRQRYVQAIVESEFYRRRYASRNMAPFEGPFNPYPVAGFPGLILSGDRPILGQVESVTHSINVAGGQGVTSVSMRSPRYWDEGEVWHWYGGQENDDTLYRSFPIWHNSHVVPQNNYDPSTGEESPQKLDQYYTFLLDVPSIEYTSNHAGRTFTSDDIVRAIEDRDPGPFDVSKETLDILEYNSAIAELDEKGRFKPGTLAHRYYGAVEPNPANRMIRDPNNYNERYGVRERELFEDFLGNEYRLVDNQWIVLYGPTFSNSGDKVNNVQQSVLEYMNELKGRTL